MTIDPLAAVISLAALLTTLIGAGIGAYVSIRVQLAVHKEILKRLELDLNNIAAAIRGGNARTSKIP